MTLTALQINARIMKWREMLRRGLAQDLQTLRRRLRKGVPSALRFQVYPALRRLIFRKEENYSLLLKKQSHYVYDIRLDIPRTFPCQVASCLQNSLQNILNAISTAFPEMGYCQGLNFVTMRLVEILNDQESFHLLSVGEVVMYGVALSILYYLQPLLLKQDTIHNLQLLCDQKSLQDVDDDSFMNCVFSFNLDQKQIFKISQNYEITHVSSLQLLSDSVQQAYRLKKMQPSTPCQWTIDQFKSTTTVLIEFD